MDSTAAGRDVWEEKLQDLSGPPISLPFEFLEEITSNFSDEREVGRGGYGVVYKGVLQSGEIIAVKKLIDAHLVDDDQFQKEVTNALRIKHENIVQLLGYCAESKWEAIELPKGPVMAQIPKRLLCFEYLPNESLAKHLSVESLGLDWNKRYEIIKGICSGLHFLHRKCHMVHLDLKPENILMDSTMMPKVADFGLSRLLGAQKSRTIISGSLAGSLGYMAPEYFLQGVVSPKADIFSFGVIIIEIITGGKEYPINTLQYCQQSDLYANHQSTKKSLHQYTEKVVGRWRNVFENEPKYTPQEIYTEQVKQCIAMALDCVDPDSTGRPDVCDISRLLTGETCSCQKTQLLSARPFELHYKFKPNHVMSFSSLHLTNNTDDPVAFRIVTKDREKYFPWPVHGLVLPRSTYTLQVKMCVPPVNDNRFILQLQSTIAGGQDQLPDVEASGSAGDCNCLFTEAKKEGHEVQQVKLLFGIIHEPGNAIILKHPADPISDIYIHPTKTWLITLHWGQTFNTWDYRAQKTVGSSEFSALSKVRIAIFIPLKQWFVTACDKGYVKVYSYKTMQEVKTFRAHGHFIGSFDIHPIQSYLLSQSSFDSLIKLWNWEKGWECVRTYNGFLCNGAKFITKDANFIACAMRNGVKIINIASTNCDDFTYYIESSEVFGLDYLPRGDELYLITGHHYGLVNIWDWQTRSCLKTLEGHKGLVRNACVHPELPLLITGSYDDGTVCLWNSFTFELEGKLDCGLGDVYTVSCLKGSTSVAIGHKKGLAVVEI